jgi:hypothetical protein
MEARLRSPNLGKILKSSVNSLLQGQLRRLLGKWFLVMLPSWYGQFLGRLHLG